MTAIFRAVEVTARDRHIKSLRHYNDVAASDASDAEEAEISQGAKEAVELCLRVQQIFEDNDRAVPPHASELDDTAKRVLECLEATKKSAKELAKVDDDADLMLREGSPPRDVAQARSAALARVLKAMRGLVGLLRSAYAKLAMLSDPVGIDRTGDTASDDHHNGADEDDGGETLAEIAAATGVTIGVLRRVNSQLSRFRDDDVIPAGTTIRLPSTSNNNVSTTPLHPDDTPPEVLAAVIAAATSHQQRQAAGAISSSGTASSASDSEEAPPGETLRDIAKKTGVPLDTLIDLNRDVVALFHPTRDRIPVGSPVRIPEAAAVSMSEGASTASSRSRPLSHQRRSAHSASHRTHQTTATTQSFVPQESLRDIAEATGVTVDELRLANPAFASVSDTQPLPTNAKLVIPSFTSSDDDAADEITSVPPALLSKSRSGDGHSAPSAVPPVGRSSKSSNMSSEGRGDTLEEIAALYGTTVATLLEHNPHLAQTDASMNLPVGTSIHIPNDVSGLRQHTTPETSHRQHRGGDVESRSSPEEGSDDERSYSSETVVRSVGSSAAGGEQHTIETLAKAFDVSEESIRQWNPFLAHVSAQQILTAGIPIRIPQSKSAGSRKQLDRQESRESATGDDISRRHSDATSGKRPLPVAYAVRKERRRQDEGHHRSTTDDDESDDGTADDDRLRATKNPTLNDIAADFGITAQYIRVLNPHLKTLADNDPIPPLTSMQLPKKPTGKPGGMTSAHDDGTRTSSHRAAALGSGPSTRGTSKTGTQRGSSIFSEDDAPRNGGDTESAPRSVSQHRIGLVSDESGVSEADPAEAERAERVVVGPSSNEDDHRRMGHPGPSTSSQLQQLASGDEGPVPHTTAPTATPGATLASTARACGITVRELRALNPSLQQYPEALPLPRSVRLTTPQPLQSSQQQRDRHSDDDEGQTLYPSAQTEETLSSISARYHIAIGVIREHNPSVAHLDKDAPIPASTALKLPMTPAQRRSAGSDDHHHHRHRHAVEGTSTPPSAPTRVSTPPATKHAAKTSPSPPSQHRPTEHKCASGGSDTIRSLAKRYLISFDALRRANPAFASCDIHTSLPGGVVLQIPSTAAPQDGDEHKRSPRRASPDAVPRIATPASVDNEEEDLLPREATPRDTYNDTHMFEERILSAQEEYMTSPNHSARLQDMERGDTVADASARHGRRGEHEASSSDASSDPVPTDNRGISARIADQQRHTRNSSPDTDSSDEDDAMHGVQMVRAGGENLRQLCRRFNLSEPAVRSANPQLHAYHHTKELPMDMLVKIPPQRVGGPTSNATDPSNNTAPQPQPALHETRPNTASPRRQDVVSKNASKTWQSDGVTTVHGVCIQQFVREDVLRQWNPFLRRYHSKTVIPIGTTVFLEAPPASHGAHQQTEHHTDAPTEAQLPTYVTVREGEVISLKTLALRHRLHEGGLRKLNPHLHHIPVDAILPVDSAVCVHAPVALRWQQRIPPEVLKSVQVLSSKHHQLTRQRYFLNWKMLASALGGKKQLAEAALRDERDQLSAAVTVGKMSEMDLRRRVTELRMVVDSMRTSSPVRNGNSPVRSSPVRGGSPIRGLPVPYDAFATKSLDRASTVAAAANISPSPMPREQSPARRPVTADVGGLAWVSQPERLTSTSPVRPRSATNRNPSPSAMQLRLAQTVAQEMASSSAPSQHQQQGSLQRNTASPKRGQKPSLGLILNGLRVVGVTGSAESAGIVVNDAILRVDGRLVSNPMSFRDAVARAAGPRVCITVQHSEGGSTAFMLPLYFTEATSPNRGGPASARRQLSLSPASTRRTTSPQRKATVLPKLSKK